MEDSKENSIIEEEAIIINDQLTSQEFVENANIKEKNFGHNKFQLEIQNYKLQILSLESDLKIKSDQIEHMNTRHSSQYTDFEKLNKIFQETKQTYENRLSNLNIQYENLKKQLNQNV